MFLMMLNYNSKITSETKLFKMKFACIYNYPIKRNKMWNKFCTISSTVTFTVIECFLPFKEWNTLHGYVMDDLRAPFLPGQAASFKCMCMNAFHGLKTFGSSSLCEIRILSWVGISTVVRLLAARVLCLGVASTKGPYPQVVGHCLDPYSLHRHWSLHMAAAGGGGIVKIGGGWVLDPMS